MNLFGKKTEFEAALMNEELLSEKEFEFISDLVYKHCGINLHEGKKELVRARIAKRLRATGYKTVSDYMKFVLEDQSGAEFTHLIDAISTNLTSFYRENQHFEFLTAKFLPSLLERKKKSGNHAIRAWSAASSSGEEPYTIAITLREAVEGAGAWDVKLLATDISTHVLRIAQNGTYDMKRVEPVPPQLRHKYFTVNRVEGENVAQVSPVLKEMIRFRHLNLMQTWPFKGPFDFIFCRNVMIYFDKPTQQSLVKRFYDCLTPGGLLFTGHSESLTGIEHSFKYVQPTIYRRD